MLDAPTPATPPIPPTSIAGPDAMWFQPLNDQVLVKLHIRARSPLEVHHGKPKVVPSGVVVAVGRGTFVPGTGFVSSQVKPGDTVAISFAGDWTPLPLSPNKNDVFVSVSESILLGIMDTVTDESPWMKAAESDEALSRVVGLRR